MENKLQIANRVWDSAAILTELDDSIKLCKAFVALRQYQKLSESGTYAVLQKARSLKIDPFDALNGGLYYIEKAGKVEMTSNLMVQLIRQAGHSIKKDEKSNDTICILHGTRVDNRDEWTESFSIKDAERASLQKEGPWKKYPRNMLFARALSNLARQLFPDVICGCYVEGEILPMSFSEISKSEIVEVDVTNKISQLDEVSEEQISELEKAFENFPEQKQKMLAHLKKEFNLDGFSRVPVAMYKRILDRLASEDFKTKAKKPILSIDGYKKSPVSDELPSELMEAV